MKTKDQTIVQLFQEKSRLETENQLLDEVYTERFAFIARVNTNMQSCSQLFLPVVLLLIFPLLAD